VPDKVPCQSQLGLKFRGNSRLVDAEHFGERDSNSPVGGHMFSGWQVSQPRA
jgi:hypothetical protein